MKKSGFLTFMLSMIPGCGLMYLGYMKKGLQFMVMFAASVFLAYIFGSPHYFQWIMVFFISLLPIIWFYQLFDAMHSFTCMKRQAIEVPLDDGFYVPQKMHMFLPAENPTITRIIAILFILIGSFGFVFGILDGMYSMFYQQIVRMILDVLRNYLIPSLISISLIIIGAKLLRGTRAQKAGKAE